MKHRRTWLLVVAALAWMLVLTSAFAKAAGKEHEMKVGKKGETTFDKETMVGDLTLKPGRYTFQHRVEGDDHFVHFTEVTKGVGYGGGSAPKSHPGEVKCRLETLPAKAGQTTLYYNDEGGVHRLTRIEVAGENVAHLF